MTTNDIFNDDQPLERRTWLQRSTAQYALAGVLAGFVFPALASIIKVSQLGQQLTLSNFMAAQLTDPLLWITDTAPFFLGLVAGLAGWRQDRVLQVNEQLTHRDTELNSIRANLEQTISERTSELDDRNAQMRSVVTFARQVADIQDIASLLPASVAMIAERFAHRDANLYLLDEKGQWAVLMASSSPSGRNLLKDGFRVSVGDASLVGRVAKRGKFLIAPKRPDNRDRSARQAAVTAPASEIGLPLVVRGKLIGVLEVESRESRAIGPGETELFQLLADQLAASIENARLVSESRATVAQLEALTSQSTRATWQQYLKRHDLSYQFTPSGVKPIAASAARPSGGLKIPLTLRGEAIGSLILQRKGTGKWSQTEHDLLQRIASQIALALENARLLEETRERAAQERVVGEISARLSRSLDVDALLQAAVREFAALPEVTEATVYLEAPEDGARQTKIN